MIAPDWSLTTSIVVFVLAAAAIAVAGSRLAGLADRLADRTGLGEALTGTLFLGFITALPGIAASVAAALDGNAALAISNAMGGIAIQTTFLAVADIVYRKANLEHAAASVANMMQTIVLILLLTIVGLTMAGPEATIGDVHPVTPLLFVAAGFGVWMVFRTSEAPMWRPQRTSETVEDVPAPGAGRESLPGLLAGFAASAAVVLVSGAAVAHATGRIGEITGVSQSVMGGLFAAVATSLPELVTTVAAVRRGALTLAVSDIVGGNLFDVLFVCFADIAYVHGSIYHAPDVGLRELFLTGMAVLLNGVLLMGLLYRQRYGVVNIGFES
ncbi:MAG: sodium:calcium antiporter, partial [Gammaproteobacteria bacterium]